MRRIIKKFLTDQFFYNNIEKIRSSVADSETFLDLGCGSLSPYQKYLRKDYHSATGVDLYADIKKTGYHNVVRKDVLSYIKDVPDKSFDAVLAFDIVEHFEKDSAIFLIQNIIRVASKVVVVVTPNGYWPGMLSGPGQEHLCGIDYYELKRFGFLVYGAGGMSFLRSKKHSFLKGFGGSLHTLPYQMFAFNFSQLFAANNPKYAYGLTAIKKIEE